LEEIASVIAEELEKFLPIGKGGYLVAGLGNRSITPDAVGPLAVEGILVTRHLEEVQPQLYTAANFSSVSAIAPGVLGQTGIESAEIIKGLCQKIQPKCLILIDSLASRKLSRLATTVQISNRGISPGGGVSNKRMAIERETVGVHVISLGVPTVVDAATLAYDILEEYGGLDMEAAEEVMDRIMESKSREMFVTPKDNDIITARTAKLIAMALNMALHRMTAEELREFTD
jgi:spore protease